VQDLLTENQNHNQPDLILHATKFLAMLTWLKQPPWKLKTPKPDLPKRLLKK